MTRFHDGPYTVGNDGYVYERTSDGWVEMDPPVTATLYGVAYPTADVLGSIPENVDVAVGSSGKVVERTSCRGERGPFTPTASDTALRHGRRRPSTRPVPLDGCHPSFRYCCSYPGIVPYP